jgi:hypothetical protein
MAIGKFWDEKRLDANDRAMTMALKLRQLHHADIPQLDEIKATYG